MPHHLLLLLLNAILLTAILLNIAPNGRHFLRHLFHRHLIEVQLDLILHHLRDGLILRRHIINVHMTHVQRIIHGRLQVIHIHLVALLILFIFDTDSLLEQFRRALTFLRRVIRRIQLLLEILLHVTAARHEEIIIHVPSVILIVVQVRQLVEHRLLQMAHVFALQIRIRARLKLSAFKAHGTHILRVLHLDRLIVAAGQRQFLLALIQLGLLLKHAVLLLLNQLLVVRHNLAQLLHQLTDIQTDLRLHWLHLHHTGSHRKLERGLGRLRIVHRRTERKKDRNNRTIVNKRMQHTTQTIAKHVRQFSSHTQLVENDLQRRQASIDTASLQTTRQQCLLVDTLRKLLGERTLTLRASTIQKQKKRYYLVAIAHLLVHFSHKGHMSSR
mmetsp:Transcript_40598/g.66717  ORF Transcript_40598/g.66717 Transcript_40598/m.66717 type:complete len:386 (-) Transcript_40598:710-1867(-)